MERLEIKFNIILYLTLTFLPFNKHKNINTINAPRKEITDITFNILFTFLLFFFISNTKPSFQNNYIFL